MSNAYFEAPLPHRVAHRGATDSRRLDENTFDAFQLAIEQGATHLETDVRATKDGEVVIFHDPTLTRLTTSPTLPLVTARIEDLTWAELQQIALAKGGRVMTLRQALEAFPKAKFNIDIKAKAAIAPAVAVLAQLGEHGRILVTSFSDRRRRKVVKQLAERGLFVNTSAGAGVLLRSYLSHATLSLISNRLAKRVVARILKDVDALQIPARRGPLRFESPAYMKAVREVGKHLHFWVINDPEHAKVLIARGASGIITDDLPAISAAIREP